MRLRYRRFAPPPSSPPPPPLAHGSRTATPVSRRFSTDTDAFTPVAHRDDGDDKDVTLHSARLHWSAADSSASRRRAAFELRTFRDTDAAPEVHRPSTGSIVTDLASKSKVEFRWVDGPPRLALLLKRPHDSSATAALRQAVGILWSRGVKVLLQDDTQSDLASMEAPLPELLQFAPFSELQWHPIDVIVVFGGDGSLIHASKAFPNACPPILAFAMGSLGFLTPFAASSIPQTLDWLVSQRPFMLRLRSRLQFSVYRKDGSLIAAAAALNEGVIGGSDATSLTKLALFTHPASDVAVTTFQGDGLIVSTPTGSTAYSLSAGGSMVHPNVPAILLTPIAPFSLSFRPVILADYTQLKIQVALDARAPARISIDGSRPIRLAPGDFVVCATSQFPLPTVAQRTRDGDDAWLLSLSSALHWNQAQAAQRPLGATV